MMFHSEAQKTDKAVKPFFHLLTKTLPAWKKTDAKFS